MTDDVDMRRRRALYRACHRGTKELDHLIGRFAEVRVPLMTGAALDEFERFLALPDPLLQTAMFNPAAAPIADHAELIGEMRRFHGLEEAPADGRSGG